MNLTHWIKNDTGELYTMIGTCVGDGPRIDGMSFVRFRLVGDGMERLRTSESFHADFHRASVDEILERIHV